MLELNSVEAYRGPAHILRGISLDIGKHEVVCLAGRNGAGKTTTIESIMGLLGTSAGKVAFEGNDISKLPPNRRAKLGIGYAPEDCGIFPELSVAQNLSIAQWLTPVSRRSTAANAFTDRIQTIFPEIGGFAERQGMNLSGGQKKMVAIARALMLSPSLLLLDEPFEGLAPIVVTRFVEAVTQIKSLGISILIAVSNLPTAVRIADRLFVIDRGAIIFSGKPQEAMANDMVVQTLRG